MDGQHDQHGITYAYSRPEWPEFYDLWILQLFGPTPGEDIPLFLATVQEILHRAPSDQSAINILDLGTGTGRIVLDLFQSLNLDSPNSLPGSTNRHVKITAMDHSASMLQYAEKKFTQRYPGLRRTSPQPDWVLGAAATFLDAVPTLRNATDLVLFSVGGLNHLTAEGERVSFLEQVREALRSCGGRSVAVVSVLREFILREEGGERKEEERGEEECRIASIDSPGLIYVKSPTVVSQVGRIRTDNFMLKGIHENSQEKPNEFDSISTVLWQVEMAWSVKMFDDGEWRKEVEGAKLQIASVQEGDIQRWYFLEALELRSGFGE